ncbi:hypothetical protein, partial [Flavobacterium sp.]|uniref:hypothetical protein n=1 Tax=Flavobacterium sp. TaxID=239 RepID=UPI0037BFD7BC
SPREETGLMQLIGLNPTKRFSSPVSLSEKYEFNLRCKLKAKRCATPYSRRQTTIFLKIK